MASLGSEVSVNQSAEFFGRFGRAGGDLEMIATLNGNDALLARCVAWLREQPEFRLVHSLYTPLIEVLQAYDALCISMGINPDRFTWDDDSPRELDFTDDPGVAVVLDRTFGSLEQEQSIVWPWAAEQQEKSWWWPKFKTDADHFFLQGDQQYKPWTQRLIRIRRTTNYGKSPENALKSGRQMPGREILTMLAQHPEVARRMNGTAEHPYLWMVGLECKVSGREPRLVPSTWFSADGRRLIVRADGRGRANPCYASPEVLGK